MNFTLEIYINTGQCGTYSLYSQGICELTYSGFTIQRNDEEGSDTYRFPVWGTIQVEIRNEVKINNDEFYEVEITSKFWNHFCILKSDIEKLKVFCDKRNQQMLLNKESICSYINKDILNMAENLLNIIEEDIMLNYRVVAYFHIDYSHIESKIFNRNYSTKGEYRYHYRLFKDTYGVKGKEKKDAEQFNNKLRQKIKETSKIMVLVNNCVGIAS